jgi:endonuclease/exonuclease/phosphatase family metal-dependent hydrolase
LVQEVWRYDESLPTVESSSIIPVTIDHGREAEEGPSIVDLARRCGLAYVYVPSARNGPDNGSRPSVDKGNAVLSSVPLSSPIALDLPLEGGRKVAVAATVRAPGGEAVRFVSAHLDVASTLVRTLVTGNQTRARQALGLIDGLRRAERGGLAVSATVVGADLNTWVGNEASLRLMWGAFPESPPWDGLGTWRMGLPLDHMFFRRDPDIALDVEGYRRIPDRYGSDHHGRRFTLIHGVAGPSASDRR